jgi:predicted RecA/RadA family phage recombinase
MAALSAARGTKSRSLGKKVSYLMKASTDIYAGGLVMIDSNGLAVPATAEASNQGCCGVATESVSSTASGNERVIVQEGIFLMGAASLAQSAVGGKVYASDDQTCDETQGSNEPLAGICAEYVSATSAWIEVSLTNSKL